MAMISASRPAPAGAASLFTPVRRVAQAFVAWRQTQETVEVLSKLSDHELNDIGVPRHAIEDFARR